MSKPIYKMYRGRPSSAWNKLSKAEQDALMVKVSEIHTRHGVKTVISCDTTWSSDEVAYFAVEEYPSIEAVWAAHAEYDALNWTDMLENQTSILGTATPTE